MAIDERFAKRAFDAAGAGNQKLAHELAAVLGPRLKAASDLQQEIDTVLDELRALGHDLVAHEIQLDFSRWEDGDSALVAIFHGRVGATTGVMETFDRVDVGWGRDVRYAYDRTADAARS